MNIFPLGRTLYASCPLNNRYREASHNYKLSGYIFTLQIFLELFLCARIVSSHGAHSQARRQLLKGLPCLVSHLPPVSHSWSLPALWNHHCYLVFRYHAYDLCSASGCELVCRKFQDPSWRGSNFSSRATEFEPMVIWTLPGLSVGGEVVIRPCYQNQNQFWDGISVTYCWKNTPPTLKI